MDDATGMRGREAVGDLPGVLHGLAQRQRPARQALAQRVALEQLHHRVRGPAVAAEVVDREDAGVRERGDRLRLTLEAGQHIGGGREVRGQHLHRDVAVELVSRAR